MKYKIKYSYDSGDSFKLRPNQTGYLDLIWSDLEVAKMNLLAIKEHYEYYCEVHSPFSSDKELKSIKKIASKKWWFKDNAMHGIINLIDDENNHFEITTPWCGYFETLNEIEIVPNQNDMKISFR